MNFDPFRSLVRAEGVRLYRDLSWRRTRDPYIVWLSEVMLQQTQVARVEERMPAWLERFPDLEALAAAPAADVLAAWQGMGYNRRALSLHKAAQALCSDYDGVFPQGTKELVALPGIGPATAQGIRAFAFDLPGVYLETNVRTVFLHHFFPELDQVADQELIPLVEAACPQAPGLVPGPGEGPSTPYALPLDEEDTPRNWYYALLDYGAHLKKTIPNPSRRSRTYAKQSRFEGSRRQKRAEIVRMLLAAHEEARGLCVEEALEQINSFEVAAGRENVDVVLVESILADLEHDGFCSHEGDVWMVVS